MWKKYNPTPSAGTASDLHTCIGAVLVLMAAQFLYSALMLEAKERGYSCPISRKFMIGNAARTVQSASGWS